jgi:copper(I)-binding protein
VNRALRAATMGVLLLSPVALSACSAGQVTQTATQERDKTGSTAQIGDITLRSAELAYPRSGRYDAGDDAELQVAIVNGGAEPDALVDVTGKDFTRAEISTSGASSATSSGASSATSSGASASASASGSPSTSGSPSASASASASAAPTGSAALTPTGTTAAPSSAPAATSSAGSSEIVIPPHSSVFVGSGDYTITLVGLARPLTTGQYLDVTFTFRKAGEVTLRVTVANPPRAGNRGETFDFHQETSHG